MPRVGLTRDTLVSAAADVADEIGFDRLTLAVLAERFGVRDASLYTHVRGLADLRESVALLAHDEWADTLGQAVAGRSGYAALKAFADAYRAFATGNPGRYAATRTRYRPRGSRRPPACGASSKRVSRCCAATTGPIRTPPTRSGCSAAPSTASATWSPSVDSPPIVTWTPRGSAPSTHSITP